MKQLKNKKSLTLSLLTLLFTLGVNNAKAEDIDFSPRNDNSNTSTSTNSSEFDNLNTNTDPTASAFSSSNSVGGNYNSSEQTQDGQISTQTKKTVKTVKIDVTKKKHFELKKTRQSIYEYVNSQAKMNGNKVIWLLNHSGGLRKDNSLTSDFFKENHSWQANIANAIKHYNDNSFHSADRGTEINAYQCSNNKILISPIKDVSRLYITYKITDCELLIPVENTKYYINGKELEKGAEISEEIKKTQKEILKDLNKEEKETTEQAQPQEQKSEPEFKTETTIQNQTQENGLSQ